MGNQRHPSHVERFLEQPQARHQTSGAAARGLDRGFAGQRQADTVIGLVADNLTVAHFDNALGIRRHLWVMGDDNHRVPGGVQFSQDTHHLLAAVGIECAGGFVGENHLAAVHQRPRDTHPLLLPARQLAGPVAGVPGQAQAREQFPRSAVALGLRCAGIDRRHFDVMQGTQVREQMVALEDKTEVVAAQLRQLLIAQRARFDTLDFVAAGGGVIQAA